MRTFLGPALAIALVSAACATSPRVLTVKSEPAEAQVCFKGKARSGYFGEEKTCAGQTPFEADRVELPTPGGGKRTVKFKDVESDKESFYVLVSRPGYLTQAIEVPEWDHLVLLKTEPPLIPSVSSAPEAEGEPPPVFNGSFRLSSEPIGALVYVDGDLRGNTPFNFDGPPGPVRIKLELEGYKAVEKVIHIESGENLRVNIKLLSLKEAAAQEAGEGPAQTAPIEPKPEPEKAKPKPKPTPKPGNTPKDLGF
jgi:uncharacterized low-complexity protein